MFATVPPLSRRLLSFVLMVLVGCDSAEPVKSDHDGEANPISVNAVADQYFEDNLQLNPCNGIYFGDYRFNDKYCINSPEKLAAQRELNQRYLQQLNGLDSGKLNAEQRITYELLRFDLNLAKRAEQFPSELLPINQFFNEYSLFAQLGSGQSAQPFVTVADYEAFLRKMDGFAENNAYNIAAMKQGIDKGR